MTRSHTLDDRAVFMTLLKEADRHALGREALALLEAPDGENVIDWPTACRQLNAMLAPLRTHGPTVRAAGPATGIDVEEQEMDEDTFRRFGDDASRPGGH